jgi:ATP-binding cassette, subfamily B, bacterial MsbA
MNNFIRSLRDAKRYWPSLALASLFSIIVAGLWGANIGAFYPILEVTIRGKSVDTWFQEQLTNQKKQIEQLVAQESDLQTQIAAAGESPQVALGQKLAETKSDLKYATRRHDIYTRAYPWVVDWIPQAPYNTIVMIVGVLLFSTVIKHVFTISGEALIGRVSLDLSRDLRQELFKKAIHLDRAQFAKHGASSFQSHITHTTEMLCSGLIATLGAAIREPLKLLACLIGAAWICPRLLFASLIVAPLLGAFLYVVTRKIRANTRRVLSRISAYHAVMAESLGNVQTIQAYQMESHEEKRFAETTLNAKKYGLRCLVLASLTKPIIEFLGVGMLGTTIICGAYLVLNQQTTLMGITICEEPLSVSALLVFFGMLVGASDPLRRLSAVYSQMYSGMVAADSIYGMLDLAPAICDPVSPKAAPKRHSLLSIRGVDFGYNPQHPVLQDINLEIPFGKTVAIVGHNGSGKSTLINLLARFYDPLKGSLMLDGIDIRELRVADVRAKIALVNQHTELFNDTVANNIRYGNPNATDAQVRDVAKEAHATEFIETALESGFESVVGVNGQKLSGGQRQRIALARALLRDPEILILDEATSQIDMRSEQLIRQSLQAHRGERTMIIITHREKLLELADLVYEVQDGKLVQVTAAEIEARNDRRAA